MSHENVTDDDLLLLVCGELGAGRRAEVEEKLKADPVLAAEAQQLREALAAATPGEEATLSTDFNASLRAKLLAARANERPAGTKAGFRRWPLAKLVAAVSAACLVVAATWWLLGGHNLAPSAYAELMQAAENSKTAEWVHLRGEIAGQQLEAWVSFHPLRTLLRSNHLVASWDSRTQRLTAYDPASRTIRTQDTTDRPWSRPAMLEGVNSFFDAVMNEIERAKEEEGAEIVEERQVVAGKRCTLFVIRDERGSEARVMVDPSAKRVIRVEKVEPDGKLSTALDLAYPETGPADIYALGVPHDARVEDVTPPVAFEDLESKVEAAREALGPTYYGIVCEARILEDGTYQPRQVATTYKKDGRYRIERYRVGRTEDAPEVEQLWKHISQGDMAGLEAWVSARPPRKVEFYEGPWQTTVQLDEKGQLQEQKDRLGEQTVQLHRMIEREVWGQPAIDIKLLPPMVPKSTTMLPKGEGSWGELVGVEHAVQGWCMGKQIMFWPVRRRQYFNPARDYVCEVFESVEGARADWQEGKDWMDALPADIPRRDFSYRQGRKVLEYAQTASGQWYARKILVEDDFGARGLVRRIIFIHVDVTRDIPDELLDPDSVAPNDFRAKEEQPRRPTLGR